MQLFYRCNTDISFGKNCQLTTLLVLTGVTSLKQLEQYKNNEQHLLIPDFYTDSLGDLLDLLEQ
jgi:ribonucleotide monophosphatase NagD (HAD superfamily)